VVLLCRSGKRTIEAGEALEAAGFSEVVNVLHGFEAIHVLAIEFKIKCLHGAGDIQDNFDGNAIARQTGFRLAGLRSGKCDREEDQSRAVAPRQGPANSLHPGDWQGFESGDTGEKNCRFVASPQGQDDKPDDNRQQEQGHQGIETKRIHIVSIASGPAVFKM
jgi:hypothetical protein